MDLSLILFQRLTKSHIHFDLKSFEESTRLINKKYKVLTSRFQDTCVFHLFTTTKDSSCGRFKLRIYQKDYEDKSPDHLMENVSFIDASKPEILEKETIIIKISDPKNGFKYIGKLTTNKFNKLLSLLKEARQYGYFSPHRQEKIARAQECLVQEALARLGKLAK